MGYFRWWEQCFRKDKERYVVRVFKWGPQRGTWTHLSLGGPLSGWGDICKDSRAVEGGSLDYDGLEGKGLSHMTHQRPPSAHSTSVPVLCIRSDS